MLMESKGGMAAGCIPHTVLSPWDTSIPILDEPFSVTVTTSQRNIDGMPCRGNRKQQKEVKSPVHFL